MSASTAEPDGHQRALQVRLGVVPAVLVGDHQAVVVLPARQSPAPAQPPRPSRVNDPLSRSLIDTAPETTNAGPAGELGRLPVAGRTPSLSTAPSASTRKAVTSASPTR